MIDWRTVPHFGEVPQGVPLRDRPSAYVVLANEDGAIAVVHAPNGTFLPGGGLDADESIDAAIHREVREECGLGVTLGAWRVHAVDRVHATLEGMAFAKRSTFVSATVAGTLGAPIEHDHRLAWLSPQDAIAVLSHGGHRWAVRQWLLRGSAAPADV